MPTSLKNLLAEAAASVPKISPQDAAALIAGGDVLVVDVRDGTEVQSTGKVQGAKHVPRGMLSSAPIRILPTTTQGSIATKPCLCTVPLADDLRWRAKPCMIWDTRTCAISAASRNGRKAAAQSTGSEGRWRRYSRASRMPILGFVMMSRTEIRTARLG